MAGVESARTLFERAYEYPEPAIYEARSDVDDYEELLERGRGALRGWKDLYRNALRNLLVYPDGQDPITDRRADDCEDSRDVLRTTQVVTLTEWEDTFDALVEWNSWPRKGEDFQESESEPCQDDSDSEYCGSTPQASFKEAAEIPACLAAWLEAAQMTTADAAKTDAGNWLRRKKFSPTTAYPREFVAGLPDSTDPPKELRNRFAHAAMVGSLVDQTEDSDAVRAARWWIGESPFGVAVDLIREGYLAGCRRWINRVLAWGGVFRSEADFHAIVQISEMVLELAQDAFSHEAPTSLWGYGDDDILRMTFPLFSCWPAASYVDETKLRQAWKADKQGRENFDELVQWESQRLWRSVFNSLMKTPCRPPQKELHVSSIRRALAQVVEREAAAFGVTVAAPLNSDRCDDETLAFIRSTAQECIASILRGATRVDATPTGGNVDGSAVSGAGGVESSDKSADGNAAMISEPKRSGRAKRTTELNSVAGPEAKGSKRTILLVLLELDAFSWDHRQNSDDLERKLKGRKGEIKAQTIRLHAPWLIDHGFIKGSQEAGNSGYWLTQEGKKSARTMTKQ